jgi:hypothetical protein
VRHIRADTKDGSGIVRKRAAIKLGDQGVRREEGWRITTMITRRDAGMASQQSLLSLAAVCLGAAASGAARGQRLGARLGGGREHRRSVAAGRRHRQLPRVAGRHAGKAPTRIAAVLCDQLRCRAMPVRRVGLAWRRRPARPTTTRRSQRLLRHAIASVAGRPSSRSGIGIVPDRSHC